MLLSHRRSKRSLRGSSRDRSAALLESLEPRRLFTTLPPGGPFNDLAGNSFFFSRNIGTQPRDIVVSDYVDANDPIDLYSFNLAFDSTFDLALAGLSDDIDVELFDAFGNQIASSTSSGTASELISLTLAAGTYYINVYPGLSDAASSYTLGVTTLIVGSGNQFFDLAGNSFSFARDIGRQPQEVIGDYVDSFDADDYYRFTLLGESNVSVGLTGLVDDLDLTVFDSQGNEVASSVEGGTSDEFLSGTLAAGDYFIRVFQGTSFAASGYLIGVLTELTGGGGQSLDTAGNTPATARGLGNQPRNITLTEFVGGADTDDYFRFTLTGDTALSVGVTGLADDLDLEILDADGQSIDASINYDTDDEGISLNLAAGTYFARVYQGVSGASSVYTLTLDAAPLTGGGTIGGNEDFGADGIARFLLRQSGIATADAFVDAQGNAYIAAYRTDGGTGFFLVKLLADGSADPNFGDSGTPGVAFIDVPALIERDAKDVVATAVTLDAMGRILIAGFATDPRPGFGDTDMILVRLTTAGAVDTSFGSGGLALGDFLFDPEDGNPNDVANAVVVGADGSIFLGGTSQFSGFPDRDFAIIKFDSNGQRDMSFGDDGRAVAAFTLLDEEFDDIINGLTIAPDGSIFAVGSATTQSFFLSGTSKSLVAVAKFTPQGALDTSFNGSGRLLAIYSVDGVDDARAVAIRPDGRLVVAGSTSSVDFNTFTFNSSFALLSVFADGTIDFGFGPDGSGVVTTDIAGRIAGITRVEVLANGRIVAGGAVARSLDDILAGKFGVAIARYQADGQLDPNFDGDGLRVFNPDLTPDNVGVAPASLVSSPGAGGSTGGLLIAAASVNAASIQVSPASTSQNLGQAFADFTEASQGIIAVTEGGGILVIATSGNNVRVRQFVNAGPPIAQLLAAGQTVISTSGVTVLQFDVQYSDDALVIRELLGADDLTVFAPGGGIINVILINIERAQGELTDRVLRARYQMAAPGGKPAFTTADNGAYTVSLAASSVADDSGAFAAGGNVGQFTVAVPASGGEPGGGGNGGGGEPGGNTPDTTAPTAAGNIPSTVAEGATPYTFTVTYTDNVAVSAASIASTNIRVVGSAGSNPLVTFVGLDQAGDGVSRVATYRIDPPGGTWDVADNATYTLFLEASAVRDTAGNTVAPAQLGSFTASFTPPPGGNLTTDMVLAPAGGIVGGTRQRVRVRIVNVGDATARGTATLRLYLSTDASFDNADREILSSNQRLNLRAGRSKTVSFSRVTMPSDIDADVHLLARIEAGTSPDTNPGDNVAASAGQFSLRRPFVDPGVTGLTGRSTLRAGKRETFRVTLRNEGNITLTQRLPVRVILSADNILDAGDTVLTTANLSTRLRAGQSKAFSVRAVIPRDIAAGSYNVFVVVDPDFVIPTDPDRADNTIGPFGFTV